MIIKLKSYLEYKESGLLWVGKIPQHWDLIPAFAAFKEHKEANKGLLESQVLSLSYGRIIKKKEDALHGLVPASFETYQIVEPDNLILRLTDLQNDQRSLRVGLVKDRGIITSAYVCLSPCKTLLAGFAYYFLHSTDVQKVFYGMGSGLRQSIGFADLKRLLICIPSIEEQELIIKFLDIHGRKVDHIISAKRRLIELLKEQKISTINRAVTQGIDPDIPMKPSGIEWLGEIPAHWDVVKLHRLAESFQTGPFGSQLHQMDYVQGGIPVINPSHMKDSRIVPDYSCTVNQRDWERLRRQTLMTGDILFSRRGEMGRCALVTHEQEGWLCGTGSLRMRTKLDQVDPEYLIMLLSSKGVANYLSFMSVGATMENLNTGILRQLPLPFPPLTEQQRIVKFVSKEVEQILYSITTTLREIELIKEYRTRLVADVVTGKFDMRGMELPEQEEDDNFTLLDDETIHEALEESKELEPLEESVYADN